MRNYILTSVCVRSHGMLWESVRTMGNALPSIRYHRWLPAKLLGAQTSDYHNNTARG